MQIETWIDARHRLDIYIFFFQLRTDADNRLTKSYKLWSQSELKEFTMILHLDEVKI